MRAGGGLAQIAAKFIFLVLSCCSVPPEADATQVAPDPKCGAIPRELVQKVWKHPSNYRQPHDRSLSELEKTFGAEWSNYVNNLPRGSTVLDLGGGLSIYGLELATEHGLNVTTVDGIDYYDHIVGKYQEPVSLLSHLDGRFGYQRFLWPTGLVSNELPLRLADLLRVPMSETMEIEWPRAGITTEKKSIRFDEKLSAIESAETFAHWARGIQSALDRLESEGKFVRMHSWAQQVLASIPDGSVDLIIDAAGSTYYSPDRPELIPEIYRKLKNRAIASFLFGPAFNDTVGTTSYLDYLNQKNPHLAEVNKSTRAGSTLLLHKIRGMRLVTPQGPQTTRWSGDGSGHEIPIIHFTQN